MNDINTMKSTEASQILCQFLADEFVLYTKTKNAHWNVKGSDFYEKHKLFEAQFQQLDTIMDDLAERIRTIGHYAPATLKEFLQLTHLTEQTRLKNDSIGFIKELLSDHESIILKLRENINHFSNELKDFGTSDLITGVLKAHEKIAWILRSHLN